MEADYRLSLQQAARLSIQVEAELTSNIRSEPLLVVLDRAKENAAAALTALAVVDPEDPHAIRHLQNEVRRFNELVNWLHEMLIAGPEAERQLNATQMQEARALVLDDDTAEQLGISTNGANDDD